MYEKGMVSRKRQGYEEERGKRKEEREEKEEGKGEERVNKQEFATRMRGWAITTEL